ncbi:hypothetical protein BO71DRAFT_227624 [Aspergillus ellipticus CBS 707.79]|uniref:Uncharacterized protein n=1 Tax=Aspergillus ellipticus CBS 707.79 TaxID=1448320 RepID=A0A319DKA9_9EURO|nr:hypothetical protein BO71DRAFT_227624 [Aspergillus ellipticus CBS 707.79]
MLFLSSCSGSGLVAFTGVCVTSLRGASTVFPLPSRLLCVFFAHLGSPNIVSPFEIPSLEGVARNIHLFDANGTYLGGKQEPPTVAEGHLLTSRTPQEASRTPLRSSVSPCFSTCASIFFDLRHPGLGGDSILCWIITPSASASAVQPLPSSRGSRLS